MRSSLPRRRFSSRVSALIICAMLANPVSGALLNVQIVGHGATPQGGSDPLAPKYEGAGIAGAAGDFWNSVAADSYGHPLTIAAPQTMVLADGQTPTRVTLTFAGFLGADCWPPSDGAPVANNLLNAYLCSRPGASVTLAGLVAHATYDLFLFGNNSHAGSGARFGITGVSHSTQGTEGAVFTNEVDYVEFRGIAADKDGRIRITIEPSSAEIAIFNGLQLQGELPPPTERAQRPDERRWAMAKFGGVPDERGKFTTDPVISFVYDGKKSADLLGQWEQNRTSRELDGNRTLHTLLWRDSQSGLEVRVVGVEYRDYPVVEWTPYLKNTGSVDTPIIESFQAIDTPFQRESAGEFVLHHQIGSLQTKEDYRPLETKLEPQVVKEVATSGGRPCNAFLPYFNIEWPDAGVIVAVGWPGQWSAKFTRDNGLGLTVTAGQELTRFKLHPGEEVRGPLMALEFYQGDRITGQNIWRRWMLAHNLPRIDGQLPPNTWIACSSHQFLECQNATEANQKLFIDRYLEEQLPLDYWWMDTGWFPILKGTWALSTGTWEVDKKRFPNGLRAISDHAHAKGLKFLVWFEPERVVEDTWLWQHHAEWLLKPADLPPQLAYQAPWRLLNLGNPEARQWLTDHIVKLLDDEGIDLYRQDFNMDPLYNWRANDAPDRQGITENAYVVGYLAYWDELRRRHPQLRIDSCASGGRRNDLETLRRAVPFIRSDYLFEPTGLQGQMYGVSYWLPFQGTGYIDRRSVQSSKIFLPPGRWFDGDDAQKIETDSYLFRSAMSPHLTVAFDMQDPAVDFPTQRKLYQQWRNVAANYYGDYYPLTPYNLDETLWMAWQFDRPEAGEGLVQAFRRPHSVYETARFPLRGLDESARYAVRDVDTDETREMAGHELLHAGLPVTIRERPGAVVLTYKKLADGP